MTSSPTHPETPIASLCAPEVGSRRADIALVAADEFTRRGYHSTRVEHIAERLAVTPGALYRHVPGKYEMFRDAVATLALALEAASESTVAAAVSGPGTPPTLEEMVASITRTTLGHRSRAALYRWQGRYLTPGDRASVLEVDARVRRRLADAVRGRRRDGHPAGASSAAAAILSCIASLGHHRIELTDTDAVALMTSIADDLATVAPPRRPGSNGGGSAINRSTGGGSGSSGGGGRSGLRSGGGGVSRLRGGAATREGAITAAIARFHSSGYDSVSMESIGADVGVAASALYRHFPGKSALLTAAVDRTATLVEGLLDSHAAMNSAETGPADALTDMLDAYVSIAFSHGPDLMLYHSELGAIDAEDRHRLRRSQRRQLDRWARLVRDAGTPDRSVPADARDDATARVRVHAALAVVLDGGQGTGFDPAAAPRFGQLAGTVLLPR
ncbi:TetR/AcrR family transcriptional regulator [Dietzia aurantiaca]|uniref:TetR/AcrR family transcriptional regulator n=1 Tax=Dietzia aurantiaca TaxID=983873 RepID=A0ABV9PUJ2_9ACTN